MRVFLALVLYTLLCTTASGQSSISYGYDAAGNRIRRELRVEKITQQSADDDKARAARSLRDDLHIGISPVAKDGKLQIGIGGLRASDTGDVALYTLQGTAVLTHSITSDHITIDMSLQTNGVYILSITINDGQQAWKILKR